MTPDHHGLAQMMVRQLYLMHIQDARDRERGITRATSAGKMLNAELSGMAKAAQALGAGESTRILSRLDDTVRGAPPRPCWDDGQDAHDAAVATRLCLAVGWPRDLEALASRV